jgi:hypothetical protein
VYARSDSNISTSANDFYKSLVAAEKEPEERLVPTILSKEIDRVKIHTTR